MVMRFLVILAFVWQPLLPGARGTESTLGQACSVYSCCKAVERVSCCGERLVEMVCEQSGGACYCDASPSDAPGRSPTLPPVRGEREIPVLIHTPLAGSIVFDGLESRRPSLGTAGRGVLHDWSHNRTQALLGIWRT